MRITSTESKGQDTIQNNPWTDSALFESGIVPHYDLSLALDDVMALMSGKKVSCSYDGLDFVMQRSAKLRLDAKGTIQDKRVSVDVPIDLRLGTFYPFSLEDEVLHFAQNKAHSYIQICRPKTSDLVGSLKISVELPKDYVPYSRSETTNPLQGFIQTVLFEEEEDRKPWE